MKKVNATRFITMVIGIIFGFGTFEHGFFEFLQGNKPTNSFIINSIGEGHRFWIYGTEPAFTLFPTFLLAGIFSMLIGISIIIWSIRFIDKKYGSTVFLFLFILSFLSGGGIGQIVFFIPAWAFSTRINKPLHWWNKVLSQQIRPLLSKIWLPFIILSTICILIGLEIAVFGYFPYLKDPVTINNTALLFVLASAILNICAYIAGFGHELYRRQESY